MQWQFERLVRRAGPLCAIGGLIWAGTASAATLTAGCTGTTGDVPSLIGTVKAANDLVDPDTIELGAGCAYTVTAVDNSWYGPNGLPAISGDLTIEGHGA